MRENGKSYILYRRIFFQIRRFESLYSKYRGEVDKEWVLVESDNLNNINYYQKKEFYLARLVTNENLYIGIWSDIGELKKIMNSMK